MRSGWCSRSDMGPSCVRHTKAPDCCPGLPRTDPPGLPLGTGSLEATKVGTGGHGSGRRTPCGVLRVNVAHRDEIPFGNAVLSGALRRQEFLSGRVSPRAEPTVWSREISVMSL